MVPLQISVLENSSPVRRYLRTQDLAVGVNEKIHVLGRDIGSIIAYACVVQYPDSVAGVIWGECTVPGT